MAVDDSTAQSQQPQPEDHGVRDAALAAVAATMLPKPPLPGALAVTAQAQMTTALLTALLRFQNRRAQGFQDELHKELVAQDPALEDVIDQLIGKELNFEATFRRKQYDRVQADLPAALAIADPQQRDLAVRNIFERERRYTQQREMAMRERLLGEVRKWHVQRTSPDGAYWKMGVRHQHCPICLSMQGQVHPWSLLENLHPPVHPQCGCTLHSVHDAVRNGWVDGPEVTEEARLETIERLRLAADCLREGIEELPANIVDHDGTAREAKASGGSASQGTADVARLGLASEGTAGDGASRRGEAAEAVARSDETSRGDLDEAAWLERYPKGFAFGGRFRPRAGGDPGAMLLRKLGLFGRGERPPEPPKGAWHRLSGRQVFVPHATDWHQVIGGVGYRSPAGTTDVLRDDHLLPTAHVPHEQLDQTHQLADAIRAARRERAISRPGQPLRQGDGPEHILAAPSKGWWPHMLRPTAGGKWKLRMHHPASGATADATIDDTGVHDATWNTAPIPPVKARRLDHPPRSWAEHQADMASWVDDLASRYDRPQWFNTAVHDPTLGDHAGLHEWDGTVRLGKDTKPDIERAARARSQKRDLTDSELRGVYSTYWTTAHEAAHSVNPMNATDYHDENANLEEALAEEMSHVLARERLHAQGQDDVIRWADTHPDALPVRGVYTRERGALADLLDHANIKPADRLAIVENLKFATPPNDRFNTIGRLIHAAHNDLTENDAEEYARSLLRQGGIPRSALPASPGHKKGWTHWAQQQIEGLFGDNIEQVSSPGSYWQHHNKPVTVGGGGDEPTLELGGKDFASGGRKAKDEQGGKWIVHTHDNDKNRVASELLANRIYRELGIDAPVYTSVTTPGGPAFEQRPDDLSKEPELPDTFRLSTGVILVRPDGKLTIIEPRGHYGGYCVPLDTRVLTREGWKEHDEVQVGDETLGFNPTTGLNEWTRITDVHHVGEQPMVRYGGERWSVRCTPQHRWVVASRGRTVMREAQDKVGKRESLVLAAPSLEGEPVDPTDAAVLAWVVTDGSMYRTRGSGCWTARITQEKPSGIAALEEVLRSVPHSRYAKPGGWTYYLRSEYLRGLMERLRWDGSRSGLPVIVARMDGRALAAFTDAAYAAEGELSGDRRRLWQNDGPVQDALVIAEYRMGRRPVVRGSKRCKAIASRRPTIGGRGVFSVAEGSAEAWCVTTELGTWTMEQRGHVALTGNSHTFPKGGMEAGLTPQQNAHKELFEETGLHGKIVGVLGDYKGTTGVTRYYVGVPTGGEPTPSDETQAIKTVNFKQAYRMLNTERDKEILRDLARSDVYQRAKKREPPADQFPPNVPGVAAAYPVPEGKTHKVDEPNDQLAAGYVADALLGNWGFVGGSYGDNLIWPKDGSGPVRVNHGGAFEYAPSGAPKDFGPVPSDLWQMLRRGEGLGTVDLSDDQMREQAKEIAAKLTPEKIDELVKGAPFTDKDMRARVTDALKERVGWLDRFAKGEEEIPEPAEGGEARGVLEDSQSDFELFPEELQAIEDYLKHGYDLNELLRKGKDEPSEDQKEMAKHLDNALGDATVTDDMYAYLPLRDKPGEKFGGQTLKQRSYTTLSTDKATAESKGDGMLRLLIPAGSHALWLAESEPGDGDVLLPRGARLKLGPVKDDGSVDALLLPYEKPGALYIKPWSYGSYGSMYGGGEQPDWKVGERVKLTGSHTTGTVVEVKQEGSGHGAKVLRDGNTEPMRVIAPMNWRKADEKKGGKAQTWSKPKLYYDSKTGKTTEVPRWLPGPTEPEAYSMGDVVRYNRDEYVVLDPRPNDRYEILLRKRGDDKAAKIRVDPVHLDVPEAPPSEKRIAPGKVFNSPIGKVQVVDATPDKKGRVLVSPVGMKQKNRMHPDNLKELDGMRSPGTGTVTTDLSGPAGRWGVRRVLVDGEHVGHVAAEHGGWQPQDINRRPLTTDLFGSPDAAADAVTRLQEAWSDLARAAALAARRAHARLTGKQQDVGVTPFREGEDQAHGFYDSGKFKQFERDAQEAARLEGVAQPRLERASGVWDGGSEPSARLSFRGSDEQTRRVMDRLGGKYDQDGVLKFRADDAGPHVRFLSAEQVRPDEPLVTAAIKRLPGATVRADGRLEIVATEPEHALAAQQLANEVGVHLYNERGYGELREAGRHYTRWSEQGRSWRDGPGFEGHGAGRVDESDAGEGSAGAGRAGSDVRAEAGRRLAEWDESKHPRGHGGKFVSKAKDIGMTISRPPESPVAAGHDMWNPDEFERALRDEAERHPEISQGPRALAGLFYTKSDPPEGMNPDRWESIRHPHPDQGAETWSAGDLPAQYLIMNDGFDHDMSDLPPGYTMPAAMTPYGLMTHELGHAYFTNHMGVYSDPDAARLLTEEGIGPRRLIEDTQYGASDPEEAFAELYAQHFTPGFELPADLKPKFERILQKVARTNVPASLDRLTMLGLRIAYGPGTVAEVQRAARENADANDWVTRPKLPNRLGEAWNGEELIRGVLREAAAGNDGAMVALYPHGSTARHLALNGDGDETPENLHLTLVFLGRADALTNPDELKQAVADWAANTPPIEGEVGGHGTFTAGDTPVTVLLPDLPGLPRAREDLVNRLKAAGQPVKEHHGFTPHITLSYKSRKPPDHGGHKLRFTHARLVRGDDHRSFKLNG